MGFADVIHFAINSRIATAGKPFLGYTCRIINAADIDKCEPFPFKAG
jgi:hypothetical protein